MVDKPKPTQARPAPVVRETEPRFAQTVAAPSLELSVQREAGQPTTITKVLDGDYFRIGSNPSNDIVLEDSGVSRFHCKLLRDERGWRIQDAGSKNGTWISRVRVRDADLVSPETRLEIGDSLIVIREHRSTRHLELLNVPSFGELYGASVAMRRLFATLDRISRSETNVLIEGEGGTGKELAATEIVRRGPRATQPFVIVDCAGTAPTLLEAELFGIAKGAMPGVEQDRIGAFESANGGTVFLDEVGALPLELQPKILRAIESKEIRRVGENAGRKLDVRVIAATQRDLERQVNLGRFREDLFHKLSVVSVRVPPLRGRTEDLEVLINVFLDLLNAVSMKHLFTKDVLKEISAYQWPGNVRELRNYVERTVALGDAKQATTAAPPADDGVDIGPINLGLSFRAAKESVIAKFERSYLTTLLEWSNGNVSRAARKAAMDRMNLHRLVQRYGIKGSRSLKDD